MINVPQMAESYTAAWCSHNAVTVALFFAPDGSLTINDGEPSIGRVAIAQAAQSFMTAFPNLKISMDRVIVGEEGAEYYWTLTGTNTGPGGTGNAVRISGCEKWELGIDGLILNSKGQFDAADYERQLQRQK